MNFENLLNFAGLARFPNQNGNGATFKKCEISSNLVETNAFEMKIEGF